jgi:hypothetical protein
VDGLRVWWGYVRYVRLPVAAAAVWAALVFAAGRRDVRRLLLFALVFLPAFLVALRIRSDYAFADRYYTPFFGGAFLTLLLVLDLGRTWFTVFLRRLRPGRAAALAAGWAAVAVLLVVFKAGPACRDVVRNRAAFAGIHENGSPTFVMYDAIKRQGLPVLVVSENCWSELTHRLYFRFIGIPFPGPVRLVRQSTCVGGGPDPRGGIARFLAEFPRGLVVLDQTDTGDDTCGRTPESHLGGGLRVERSPGGLCAWFIRGARSAADVRRVARLVEFRSLAWWYGR